MNISKNLNQKPQTLKHYSKIVVFLLTISLTLTDCEKEKLSEPSTQTQKLEINKVSIDKIPDIEAFMSTKHSKKTNGKGSSANEAAIFDNQNILETIR